MNIIAKAYEFAQKKHQGQEYNKQSFIVHPLLTSRIISVVRDPSEFDENLVAAALLHDTLEDTDTNYETLVYEFGEDVASLVQEVTKTTSNCFPNLHTQRGAMLKFADRLANISNTHHWSEEKRQKYIFEKSKFWK